MLQALQAFSELTVEEVIDQIMTGTLDDVQATAAASLMEHYFPSPNRLN